MKDNGPREMGNKNGEPHICLCLLPGEDFQTVAQREGTWWNPGASLSWEMEMRVQGNKGGYQLQGGVPEGRENCRDLQCSAESGLTDASLEQKELPHSDVGHLLKI